MSQYRVSEEPGDQGHVLKFEKADGLTCISADDQNRGMRRCKQKTGWGPSKFCVYSAKEAVFGCSGDEVMDPEELLNWACLEPLQWDQALEYCKKKKSK